MEMINKHGMFFIRRNIWTMNNSHDINSKHGHIFKGTESGLGIGLFTKWGVWNACIINSGRVYPLNTISKKKTFEIIKNIAFERQIASDYFYEKETNPEWFVFFNWATNYHKRMLEEIWNAV